MASSSEEVLVGREEAKDFVIRCMESVGACSEHSEKLADALVTADCKGHYSHGLNRTHVYVYEVQRDICEGKGTPEILKESPATAFVDGKNLLGPVVGDFCMDLAIRKAKTCGIGMVGVKGSNHFGICSWYSEKASDQGLIGFSSTNSSPCVITTRGKKGIIGTNPLSLAAPGLNNDSFVLDSAASVVAMGKVEVCQRKGKPVPPGWGVDKNGKMTTDPNEITKDGALCPLGGEEITGGYKGYGLSFMVEILCGILNDAAYGPNVRPWMTVDSPANLAHNFMAIDPNAFAGGFEERLQDLMDTCRNQEPAEGCDPVLVAGDPERKNMKKCEKQGGIQYHINQMQYLDNLAKELKIAPIQRRS